MTHRQRLLMIVTTLVAALGLSFAGAGVAGAAPKTAAAAPVTALATPVTGKTADGGTFAGSFTPSKFSAQNGSLLATGMLTGTLKNASGATVGSVTRTVSTPAAVTAASCSILNLVLGPLHLNLLGLVVDLNQVVLVITAVPGAGALLGNLLCAVAGLLDGTPTLGGLAALLNSILALLGQL